MVVCWLMRMSLEAQAYLGAMAQCLLIHFAVGTFRTTTAGDDNLSEAQG